MPDPTPTKLATDKIVVYLPKLNELELGRISSEIKRVRQSRKDKINGASELQFDGEKKNTA